MEPHGVKKNAKPLVLSLLGVAVLLFLFALSPSTFVNSWRVPASSSQVSELAALRRRYITAVRDSILGVHLQTPSVVPALHKENKDLEQNPFSTKTRSVGLDWPLYGVSMIGGKRMDNVWQLLDDVIARGIPGSFTECGVWRGGASIFAKAVLTAHGEAGRGVHLVDSFAGLPPNTTSADEMYWNEMSYIRVSLDEVRAGFERFGLLDDGVHFHKGYFRYALPTWKAEGIPPIAVLRLDGDMYESTLDELYNLWDAISPGGYVIIDDWSIKVCRTAVKEFFERNKLSYSIHEIDGTGAYFQKSDAAPIDAAWYTQWNSTRSTADAQPAEKAGADKAAANKAEAEKAGRRL